MKRVFTVILILFGFFYIAEAGTIEGKVTNAKTGEFLPGINVKLKGTKFGAVTDKKGHYVIKKIPAGDYVIIVNHFNWRKYESDTVRIAGNAAVEHDIKLTEKDVHFSDVVVYGVTKSAEKITESPAAVTVMYPPDIQRAARRNQIARALEATPGVDILQNGATDFIVNTRGFNSGLNRRVLVIQDGRNVAMPLLDAQEWNSFALPLDDFKRVELVRGPAASLYGANAFNGVLNLTSFAPHEIQGTKVSILAGDYQTMRADVRHAAVAGNFEYKVTAGYSKSLNYSKSRTSADSLEYPGLAIERRPVMPDDRKTFAYYGTMRMDYNFTADKKAVVEGGYSKSGNEMYVFGLGRTLVKAAERPWVRVAYNSPRINVHAHFMNRYVPEPMWLMVPNAPLHDNSKDVFADFQHNFFTSDRLHIIWGISEEYQYIQTDGTSIPRPVTQWYTGLYGQAEWEVTGILRFVGSARVDYSSIYQTQFSPRLALVLSPGEGQNFRLSAGRAFQRPNYSELYRFTPDAPAFTPLPNGKPGPPVNFDAVEKRIEDSIAVLSGKPAPDLNLNLDSKRARAIGNDKLIVEENIGFEFGYKGIFSDKIFVTCDVYYNLLNDFITNFLPGVNPEFKQWTPNLEGDLAEYNDLVYNMVMQSMFERDRQRLSYYKGEPTFIVSNTNVGQVDEWGLELGINYYITNELLLSGNYSYYDFKVLQADANQPLLPNTSPHKFNLTASYVLPKTFDLSVTFSYVHGYDWLAGTYVGYVPAYNLINLNGGAYIIDNLRLGFNIYNLLNYKHYEIFGGTYLPRMATANMSFEF
jgi:iron complex outermembrane receptor protein